MTFSRMTRGFLKSAIALLCILEFVAVAVTKDREPSASKSGRSGLGTYSLVEWNPADLMQDRVRIGTEYVIVDGFAFGVASEYQKRSTQRWRNENVALGLTATQYLESQNMTGTFVKGEFDIFHVSYEGKTGAREHGNLFGSSLGADLGYRFLMGRHVTGAAAYGLRRHMPDFFNSGGKPAPKLVTDNMDVWDVRLQLSLGVAL